MTPPVRAHRLTGSHGPDATPPVPRRPHASPDETSRQRRRRRGRRALSVLTCGLRSGDGSVDEHSRSPSPPPMIVQRAVRSPNHTVRRPVPRPTVQPSAPPPPPPLPNGQPDRSRGWYFFFFPPEIRNLIYDFSLHWPTSKELYAPYNKAIDTHYAKEASGIKEDFPRYHGRLRTPTILLLCRGITAECLPILQSRRFVIDRLPPWLPGAPQPMLVSKFIGRRTLQSLKRIDIRLPLGQGNLGSGWVWSRIIDDIFSILGERNAFEDLRLVLSMFNFNDRNIWEHELQYLQEIKTNIMALRYANPRFWAPGRIDEEYWLISGENAQRHELSRLDVVAEFTALPESRKLPHKDFWSGGLLEFA